MPFLRWLIFILFAVVTVLEYKFLLQKNKYIEGKIA